MVSLRQQFVTKGYGTKKTGERGGSVIWDRRPMTREEATHVAGAVVTAMETLKAYLGDLPEPRLPDAVLASIEDPQQVVDVCEEWIKEAEEELQRRLAIVDAEMKRRQGR